MQTCPLEPAPRREKGQGAGGCGENTGGQGGFPGGRDVAGGMELMGAARGHRGRTFLAGGSSKTRTPEGKFVSISGREAGTGERKKSARSWGQSGRGEGAGWGAHGPW